MLAKLRAPDSIEDAVTQAKALLGVEAISTALNAINLRASPSLIDKWCDADAPQTPSLAQVLALEKLLIKTGNAPIFVELFTRLQPAVPVYAEAELRPLPAASRVVCSAAEVLERIEKADDDGRIEPFELVGLLAAIDRMQKRVAPLRRSLFARVRRGGISIPPTMAADQAVKLPASLTGGQGRDKRKRR